ncbi:hypothetical protein CDL15_Pgr024142 [Punica granatum]|nr:hypothetical protein CDL15_Pgr024142 [Punica granatum]
MDPPARPSTVEIRSTMTTLLNVFSVHPVHADHPGRHLSIQDAIPLLSALDRSHGLTVDQLEGLGHLLSNWNRIVGEAAGAMMTKKQALEQLEAHKNFAVTIESLELKRRFLEKQHQSERAKIGEFRAAQIRDEWKRNYVQIEILKQESHDLDPATLLKEKIQQAEESLKKAEHEWQDLKTLLSDVSSLFK